jgi:hypothetical protein
VCAPDGRGAQRTNDVDHLLPAEWFVENGGGIEAGGLARRHHDDRNVGEIGVAPLRRAKRPAVHDWHLEVEQDQFGGKSHAKEGEGFVPVGCGRRREPREMKLLRHHFAQRGIVFDDQDRISHPVAGVASDGAMPIARNSA